MRHRPAALHLIETGVITARGTLGPLLAIEPHRPVYDGDQSPHQGHDYHGAWAHTTFDAAR